MIGQSISPLRGASNTIWRLESRHLLNLLWARRTADRPACVAEATSAFAARQSARYGATAAARRRPGPQRLVRCNDSGILRTTSTERRAAGGDRPRWSLDILVSRCPLISRREKRK